MQRSYPASCHKWIFFCYCLISATFTNQAQQKIVQWDRFEVSYQHHCEGNSFDVKLKATFQHSDTSFVVNGFYDGNSSFKIRFMPPYPGKWHFITHCNIKALNNQKGVFECVKASRSNHGMVRVAPDGYSFEYSDGKPYYPFGTTAYAWTHMGNELQEQTLKSLAGSSFNKVRMCIFPKNYDLVKEEPSLYPFEIKSTTRDAQGNEVKIWDYTRFNPLFFQRLEKQIDELNNLGIQADLILFHPYDKGRWGFDSMPNSVNVRYLDYLISRIGSFRNVWWSIANEWNLVKAKTHSDWDLLSRTVANGDPYRHLCSIHGATAFYYEYWQPWFTHVSIQDEAPVMQQGSGSILRNIYHKPVICDEVGYEGNLQQRWGRYSPEQMTHLVWNGVTAGIYVTHGETYLRHDAQDTIFWAHGGKLRGESWKRIAFLRKILEDGPGPLAPSDVSRDIQTSSGGIGSYLIYFGKEVVPEWTFNLPTRNGTFGKVAPGSRFKIEIIDTWDMTITPVADTFETTTESDYRVFDKEHKKIRLPLKPYIALRISAIH